MKKNCTVNQLVRCLGTYFSPMTGIGLAGLAWANEEGSIASIYIVNI